MKKSQRLRFDEIQAVFRLLSDIRELRHDRPSMHQRIVDGLVQLLHGTGGFISDVDGWRPDGEVAIRSFTLSQEGAEVVASVMRTMIGAGPQADPTFDIGKRLPGRVRAETFSSLLGKRRSDIFREYRNLADVLSSTDYRDHMGAWHHTKPIGGKILGLSIHRYGKSERLFSGRELELARLVFDELHWLTLTGRLDPPIPEVAKLSPRRREVLDLMLRGHAAKQIAYKLGIATHTARDHIKAIYRELGIEGGRHELMARFVQKK
jgi:DNA-binding CsgD family transcriptional regulator